MHDLNVSEGNSISIIGPTGRIEIICLSLHPTDEGKPKEMIRIDAKTRKQIGTSIGQTVTVQKTIRTQEPTNPARTNRPEKENVSNSIIISGSCIDFERERPKIVEFMRSLQKEVHLDNNYFKCYTSYKKTLGWDFFEISVDLVLVQRLIEIHPEINKQEATTLEERFVLWLHSKMKKWKLDYHLKVSEIPYESVSGFRLNPNDFRNIEDMENMR